MDAIAFASDYFFFSIVTSARTGNQTNENGSRNGSQNEVGHFFQTLSAAIKNS